MMKDLLVLAGVVLTVALLGVYFLTAKPADRLSFAPVEVPGSSIVVEDQVGNDMAVQLQAELAQAGWITIHESLSGAPAEIIGTSRLLQPGAYDNLGIDLTAPMLPGFSYITLLHLDNGDGQFIVEEDYPVMVNGVVVRPDFVFEPSAVTIPEPPVEE